MCPPACPPFDEMRKKAQQYTTGLVVQTIGEMEDDFDFETMGEIYMQHEARYRDFYNEIIKEFPNLLALGSDSCKLCPDCTYPD